MIRELNTFSVTQENINDRNEVKGSDDEIEKENEPSRDKIPEADRGWPAWRFALIAFAIDGLVWGPPQCYGIFLPFKPYSELSPSLAASIGTVCLGFLHCFGIILSPLALRSTKLCTWSARIGAPICFLGLLISSYSKNGLVLLLTQGVMYGIGGSMIYTPNLIYLSEWWIMKRGLMGGFTFTGSAVIGLAWAPLMQWLLEKYPVDLVLRYYSIAWFAFMLVLLPFFYGRLPKSSCNAAESINMDYLKLPLFWYLNLLNFIQSLVYYVPTTIYSSSYASAMGGSESFPLELYTAASAPSQVIAGLLSDKMDFTWILFASCFLGSLSVFLIWGFCKNFLMFCAFCLIYGLLVPAFTSLYARFAMKLAPNNPRSGSIVNFFFASRGMAIIATGPICGLLLKPGQLSVIDFRWVINYCGISLLVTSFLGIGLNFFGIKSSRIFQKFTSVHQNPIIQGSEQPKKENF